jgi:endogenous inhibitor of DNA gyrase (YacG/DUF329 family)
MAQRQCVVCETLFTVRPQAPHGKFCSTRCRMSNHRASKRKLVVIPQYTPEEQSVKEEQKRRDTAEYLKAYIARHMHSMSPEAIAEELQVPLFAVKLHWPNPAR